MDQVDELLNITVEGELADLDGQLIRDVLQKRYQMSRKIIRKLVEGEGIHVNGEHVWVTWRLKAGDTLRLLLPAEESEEIL
ncbi:MAG: RluA family pseudouridine synthase, partial [Tumebacillaceae bacterium]